MTMGTNLRHSDGRQFRYIGKNGSFGYLTGEVYTLFFRARDGYLLVRSDVINAECPYTMYGFMKCWEEWDKKPLP